MANNPFLRKLNTANYEINKIQDFTNNTINQINNFVNDSKNNYCVLSINNDLTFFPAGAVNAYIIFNNVIFDPQNSYDATTGIFKSPVAGVVKVSIHIVATGTTGKIFQIVAQVNKTAITPLATKITNFDASIAYATTAVGTEANLTGEQYLNLNKNDSVRLVLYSDSPSVTFVKGNNNQKVAYSW